MWGNAFVPSFDGKASSFLDYEQRVQLWLNTTEIPEEKRATSLLLHMDTVARQVCLNSGGDVMMNGADAALVLQALRQYFQPDAVDQVFQQIDKFMKFRRIDQTMERFLMEFGILRMKADKHIYPSGGTLPDSFVSFLCMQAAQLNPTERSLLMASIGCIMDFAKVSQQLRHLFQPKGTAKKEDALVASEAPEDLSYEAWVAYKNSGKKKNPSGGKRKKSLK